MRWGWKVKVKELRRHLENVESALEDEVAREQRVESVASRIEESRRRNHITEAIEESIRYRRRPT